MKGGGFRSISVLVLALLFLMVPVMFALIRALQTGTDFRAVWMLTVSLAGAVLITLWWRRARGRLAFLGMIVFATCTVLSAGVATLLGAKAAFGVWAVSGAFGLCLAAATTLFVLSRPETV